MANVLAFPTRNQHIEIQGEGADRWYILTGKCRRVRTDEIAPEKNIKTRKEKRNTKLLKKRQGKGEHAANNQENARRKERQRESSITTRIERVMIIAKV